MSTRKRTVKPKGAVDVFLDGRECAERNVELAREVQDVQPDDAPLHPEAQLLLVAGLQ